MFVSITIANGILVTMILILSFQWPVIRSKSLEKYRGQDKWICKIYAGG